MAKDETERSGPKTRTKGGLVREVSYLYEDESAALERAAQEKRCSKSEVVRRALREYLGL